VVFTGAMIHLQAGDLPEVRRWAMRLLALGAPAGSVYMAVWAHELLGRVAYEWDDLAAAERHFAAVLAERHRCHLVAVREALIGLTLTRWAQGRPDDAEAELGDLTAFLEEMGGDGFPPMAGSMRARLALRRGERPADDWRDPSVPPARQWFCYFEDPQFTRIRVMLAREADAEAVSLLTEFLAKVERERAVPAQIAALATLALALRDRGDEAGALDRLAAALELAAPGGFVRAFLDLGEPMAALLRDLAAREPPSPHLARLLAAVGGAPSARAEVALDGSARPAGWRGGGPPRDAALALLEILTVREVQVLEHLVRHLTNEEIAAALGISPLTVKRHLSSLYGKLGARTRRQAVAIAAAVGLTASHST
jgi:LuxR family maltose regulon positive regulatory protein